MADVVLDVTVTMHVEREPGGKFACPECGRACSGYDHRLCQWRHLDTDQFQTIVAARLPRVQCPVHGVRQIGVPWTEPGSGFTAMFESLVIDWLREASNAAVARLMNLSRSAVDSIMQRTVAGGLKRREAGVPQRLCVDETSFRKRYQYVTVVSNPNTGHVVHMAGDSTKRSLEEYYETLNEEQNSAIQSVSMDMWPAYIGLRWRVCPKQSKRSHSINFMWPNTWAKRWIGCGAASIVH